MNDARQIQADVYASATDALNRSVSLRITADHASIGDLTTETQCIYDMTGNKKVPAATIHSSFDRNTLQLTVFTSKQNEQQIVGFLNNQPDELKLISPDEAGGGRVLNFTFSGGEITELMDSPLKETL